MKKKKCKNCTKLFSVYNSTNKYCSFSCTKEALQSSNLDKTKNKKANKKEKTERQKAKENAWNAFSIYIRTRDCLRFTGNSNEGRCVTCMRPHPFKKLQAGHFISGRGNAVLFDERLVYTQCIGCNGNPPYGKGGNYVEYFAFMIDEVGLDKINEFRALKNDTKQYKIHDFVELEELFKKKTKKLLQQEVAVL